jgi:hypothetical protein
LRWEGGDYLGHKNVDSALGADGLQRNFNDAIKKSLEQEKLDRK